MTLVMYDSIDLSAFHGLAMDAAAGYVDGSWPTYGSLPNHTPPGTTYLSITVFGAVADCVDQEPGNIEPAPAADWIKQRLTAGQWKPVLYTSASNVQNMINLCSNRGVARSEFRIWSAHYTYVPHICNELDCGYPQADATQWTDKAHGRNLDQSELKDNFFGADVQEPPVSEGYDSMAIIWLNKGQGATTVVAIPPGASRFRSASNNNATLRIDFIPNGAPTNTMTPRYDNVPDWAIPPGTRAIIVHRQDAGNNDVSMSFG